MLIYKATNVTNNKSYVGYTTKTLIKRKEGHLSGNLYFDKELRKCPNNFTWEIVHDNIEDFEELKEKEIYYIKYFNTSVKTGGGYNISPGGVPKWLSKINKEEEEEKKLKENKVLEKLFEYQHSFLGSITYIKRRNITPSQWAVNKIKEDVERRIKEQTKSKLQEDDWFDKLSESIDTQEVTSYNLLSEDVNKIVAEMFHTNKEYIRKAKKIKVEHPDLFDEKFPNVFRNKK